MDAWLTPSKSMEILSLQSKMNGKQMADLLLDTHVFLWFAQGKCLPKEIVRAIEISQSEAKLHMSDISSWELSMLEKRERISLNMECLSWLKTAISRTGIQLKGISPEVAVDSSCLDWAHKDPADRIIVSTARHLQLTLVTADQKIIDYGEAGHVKVKAFKKLSGGE